MNSELSEHWHSGSGPMLFDADYAAWLKTLSPKARRGEVKLEWQNLCPFTISAYGVHLGLIGSYQFMRHRNKLPAVLPNDCTPEGFYLKAIETRRQQIGLHNPFSPTPYERLGAFSRFIYQRMAERIATSAGLCYREAPIDDGLGDASNGATGDDDGLGGVESPDGLDDGLGGPLAPLDDGLGDGL